MSDDNDMLAAQAYVCTSLALGEPLEEAVRALPVGPLRDAATSTARTMAEGDRLARAKRLAQGIAGVALATRQGALA